MKNQRTFPSSFVFGLIAALTFMGGSLWGADELIKKNADFEEWNSGDLLPKAWAINASYKGKVKMITNRKEVHDGEGCVLLESDPEVSREASLVYNAQVPISSDRQYLFKVWAHGEGKLILYIYQYSATSYIYCTKPNSYSKPFELTDQWQEYSFDYVPRSEDEAIKIMPAIHVAGKAWLDDASLTEGDSVKSN